MDIGIDFGSTYSLITTFDQERQSLIELKPAKDVAVTPSSISIKSKSGQRDTILFGIDSKKAAHRTGYRHFSGFKMMLVEKDPEKLKESGYDNQYTPQYVTFLFLQKMLNGILLEKSQNGTGFSIPSDYDNVCICVPELWAKYARTMDGCYALKKILTDNLKMNNVTIVMEPEAASAYFAYEYKNKFNGHLLLIDFGGGTLDVTLSEVVSDGSSITVKRVASDGLGENHKNAYGVVQSGQAGMAYIQHLALNVLERNHVTSVNTTSNDFKELLVAVEDALMDAEHIDNIRKVFSKFGEYSKFNKILSPQYTDLSDEENVFMEIEYEDNDYKISYADLFEAYQQVIEKGFEETIRNMCRISQIYIQKDPCTVEAGERDDFKIALVGGFGSFYFVQKQIEKIFNIDDIKSDRRTRGLTVTQREKAVSFGAALLAARKVILKKTAPYSLGLQVQNKYDPGKRHLIYAIPFNHVIENEQEICYIRENDGSKSKFVSISQKGLRLISYDKPDTTKGYPMKMKPELMNTLRSIPNTGAWYIGFSLDENLMVTMHIISVNDETRDFQYLLDNYELLFDMQTVEEVYEGQPIGDDF